ncbi:AAA family ATPase [Rhodocaloribacter litoris]|uniref:AAA family ATPase n=1 Tax=Rhodocaloribacter litoris TaxID=2558931 RepID=UPI00141D9D88|nr:AAA family ATPase [Rhodocaloribacter litoris]QXD15650.1 AAA family ATPase [Rhodocaloribacter litoris]
MVENRSENFSLLGERADRARYRHFVGRRAELELFAQALQSESARFSVLYVFGPGGVGKTALLREYATLAAEQGRSVYRLDGRDMEPSPQGFLLALSQAIDPDVPPLSLDALADLPPAVLLLDTYERLAVLDDWLREAFLPALPAQLLVVMAGRQPPSEPWYTDPAWRELARVVSLRNLRPEESRQLLTTLHVPGMLQEAILDVAYGHPLALVLLADWLMLGTTRAEAISLEHAPDVVHLLMQRFLQDVPTPEHRQALEACALARVTTEALLVDVLGEEAAPPLFAWLRGLSFIETGPEGVFPHDLVRDAVEADLRWRNPEVWRRLYRQVRHHLTRRFWHSSGLARQQAFFDLIYLQRHHPLMKPFYDWRALGGAYHEPATPQDHAHILAMVEQHEGPESARIAAYWLQHQPQAFVIFRGADALPVGFTANLLLDTVTPRDEQADPALQAIRAYMRRYGPLRPGERIQIARFWMGREVYQAPLTHNMITLNTVVTWLTTPNLAWTFCCMADPAAWEGVFTYINFCRVAEADFEVGGRRYGGFAHDWRVEPLPVWNEVMEERALSLSADWRPEPVGQPASPPLLVLSQPEFAEAVRRALRDFARPDRLSANPLMRSRLLRDRYGPQADTEDLQELIEEAAKMMQGHPKDDKLYQALRRTYLRPAPSQEKAAELLDLPFSTYRYHLRKGIERVTEWLWRQELYGGPVSAYERV